MATAVTFAMESSESAPTILRRIGENMVSAYVGSTMNDVASGHRGDLSSLVFHWPGIPGENPPPGIKLTLSMAWDGERRRPISAECAASIQKPAAAIQLSDALEQTSGLVDFRWYLEVGSTHWQALPV